MKGSVWLSMTILWAAYAMVFYGYVLLKDYDVSFGQVVDPFHYYAGAWPPATYTGGGIFPSGQASNSNTTPVI